MTSEVTSLTALYSDVQWAVKEVAGVQMKPESAETWIRLLTEAITDAVHEVLDENFGVTA
jgi:hypothetical protein